MSTDISIKIDAVQTYVTESIGNYCVITQDGRTWYFFIMKANWKAEHTVELELSIDSLNTFAGEYEFNDKTSIIRQHADRYERIDVNTPAVKQLVIVVQQDDENLSWSYEQDEAIGHFVYTNTSLQNCGPTFVGVTEFPGYASGIFNAS